MSFDVAPYLHAASSSPIFTGHWPGAVQALWGSRQAARWEASHTLAGHILWCRLGECQPMNLLWKFCFKAIIHHFVCSNSTSVRDVLHVIASPLSHQLMKEITLFSFGFQLSIQHKHFLLVHLASSQLYLKFSQELIKIVLMFSCFMFV